MAVFLKLVPIYANKDECLMLNGYTSFESRLIYGATKVEHGR